MFQRVTSSIGDFVADFESKNTSEKIKAVKRHIIQIVVIGGLICSPFVISKVHDSIVKKIHQQQMIGLSMDDKWRMLRDGEVHLECTDSSSDDLRHAGYTPGTPAAINYALDQGYCDFAPNY